MAKETVTLTSMSVKSANFNPRQILAVPEAERKEISVGRIMGIARGVKFGEDRTGKPWTALTGEFVAQNYAEPDRTYVGGKLFLPEGLHDMVESAVIGDGEVSASGRPVYNDVEFALEIIVAPANNPIGYSYKGKMLIDAKPSDPVAALLERVGAAPTPALPAPKAEEKKGKK